MGIALLTCLAAALLSPWVCKFCSAQKSGWILSSVPLGLFFYFLSFLPQLSSTGPMLETHSWVPSLGINLSFYLDGLSELFTLVITGIGVVIMVYAGAYCGDSFPKLGRLYMFLFLFMAAMLGLVLADNLIALFIFWELTSVCSFFLIGTKHEQPAARDAANKALLITGAGGLALLAGFILLAMITGQQDWSGLLSQSQSHVGHSLFGPMLILIFLGALTKSAQFPFHFWLPSAMAAPAPVSAYLHSATMVKAGIYLLCRSFPIMSEHPLWLGILVPLGIITMLIGGFFSYISWDLKKILAYSTVGTLGIMVSMIGLGSYLAIEAVIVLLVAHALSKAALFLTAGTIEKITGTRLIDALGGLGKVLPFVGVAAGLAALSKIGMAPFFGFYAKELAYKSSLLLMQDHPMVIISMVIGNMFLASAIIGVGIRPFLRKNPIMDVKSFKRAPASMWLSVMVLGALGAWFGLAPGTIEHLIIEPTIEAIRTEDILFHLKLWHGFDAPLILSIVTFAGGISLFFVRFRLRVFYYNLSQHFPYKGPHWFELGLDFLKFSAKLVADTLQHGFQRIYIRIFVMFILLLMGLSALNVGFKPIRFDFSDVHFYEVGVCIVIAAAAIASMFLTSSLQAVMALGLVGAGMAFIFILYGAPDLAMTQILIETLSVLLILFVLKSLPTIQRRSSKRSMLFDGIISSCLGLSITLLTVAVVNLDVSKLSSEFFAKMSYLEAHGRNVVNVIIVDFRAFDTLGEITVLAVAGLGVYSLLKWKKSS